MYLFAKPKFQTYNNLVITIQVNHLLNIFVGSSSISQQKNSHIT